MSEKTEQKPSKKPKKKGKVKKFILTSVGIVFGTFIVAVIASAAIIIHFANKVNYVPLAADYTVLDETETFTEDVTSDAVVETSSDSSQDELDEYQQAAADALKDLGLEDAEMGDVYNILLVGSDTRVVGDTGRSDTMMLVSINSKTQRIVATSFLRDLYVYIPEKDYYDKINAAYAYGGIELLLDTLQYNFSIEVDRYLSVDFYSFIEVVDILGGIDVDVQEDELYWCNQYIHASNLLVGCGEDEDYLTYADGSYQHLNGKQALAYSRFRYVGNGDFSRTERQRKVVNLIFDKLKTIDAPTLVKLLDSFLPQVTTNVPTNEFLGLIAELPDISNYEIISWGIPDDEFKYLTIDGISSIGIDFKTYIHKLYDLIYTDLDE